MENVLSLQLLLGIVSHVNAFEERIFRTAAADCLRVIEGLYAGLLCSQLGFFLGGSTYCCCTVT